MADTAEFMPTTQQVEDAFSHDPAAEYADPINYPSSVTWARKAFRRWLADHDKTVRAAQIKRDSELAAHVLRHNEPWCEGGCCRPSVAISNQLAQLTTELAAKENS